MIRAARWYLAVVLALMALLLFLPPFVLVMLALAVSPLPRFAAARRGEGSSSHSVLGRLWTGLRRRAAAEAVTRPISAHLDLGRKAAIEQADVQTVKQGGRGLSGSSPLPQVKMGPAPGAAVDAPAAGSSPSYLLLKLPTRES